MADQLKYVVYARKYRPQNFEEMIGQKHVVQTIQNAVRNNRIAQAYIFSGMRGIGKTTTARLLAKALNCKHGPTPQPCNECEFCVEINEDRAVDVLEIDGASNRGIDEVRSLREGVKYKPIHSRYKVIIIDEVHMLTREAFNALLKTLEEPPPHTIFIFATTEFHKIPNTIASRCQHFEFKKIPSKDIVNHLLTIAEKENLSISDKGLNLIAQAAEGSVRDAQRLLDQAVAFSGENIDDKELEEILGAISPEVFSQFAKCIMEGKAEGVFPLIEKLIQNGYDLMFFYRGLIQYFRNLLLIKTVSSPQELLFWSEDEIKTLKEEVKMVSAEDLLRYLTTLQDGEQGLKFSSHPRIYLETVLVKLCHYKKLIPLQQIINEIELLKRETKSSSPLNPDLSFSPVEKGEEEETLISPFQRKKKISQSKISKRGTENNNKFNFKEKAELNQKRHKEVDKALQDPQVKTFIDTFKAQIISVKSVNKKKN